MDYRLRSTITEMRSGKIYRSIGLASASIVAACLVGEAAVAVLPLEQGSVRLLAAGVVYALCIFAINHRFILRQYP